MGSALEQAFSLIIHADSELLNILATTAKVSLTSSIIALIIGVPLGIWLGSARFPGRETLIVIFRTLMGMPPVVCGLLFYLLFSGVGPFRHLHLLFTVTIMIIAQVVLIIPLVVVTMETQVHRIAPTVKETTKGLGLSGGRTFLLLLGDSTYSIFSSYMLAFARAIAEVGAVSMVGGAIAWKTNVMTTAIMQYTNRGNFSLGIALGIILIALALIINIILRIVQRRVAR